MSRHDLRKGNGPLKPHVFPHGRATGLLLACALLAFPSLAQAGHVTISWDPDPDPSVVGYKIHNAPGGQAFATPIDVGNVSSYTLTGLNDAIAYRAAVSAYDDLGQESALSTEVLYTPKKDDPTGDTDQDGLPDSLEIAGCTSPTDADSDDDGIPDGSEDANRDGARDAAETSPCAADTDGDGLQDGTELSLTAAQISPATNRGVFRPDLDPATATDPLSADTDGDGLADGNEDLNANGRVDVGETDPLFAESSLLFADNFSDGSRYGDPSWKRIRGSWSVTGSSKRFTSTNAPVSLALIADPRLGDFRSGRIESSVVLTRASATSPNARLLFHYQDGSHYRYVRLTGTGIAIGQVGSNPVEKAGEKASLRRLLKLNTDYRVRVDIEGGTDVKVYVNDSATPLLSYRFTVNSSGGVGYRTEGAKSLFDNAAIWSDAALQ